MRLGSTAPAETPSTQFAGSASPRRLLDIAMLYASKAGAILVGVLILPQFNRLLGPDQFGVVALMLSFQALLMLLDLGMATVVGRDIAAADLKSQGDLGIWHTAEVVICAQYVALAVVVTAVWSLFDLSLSLPQLFGTLLLFWALTMQNVGQSALLARYRFVDAGSLQLLGVLIRGVVTWLALTLIEASLSIFITSQAICAMLQLGATHWRCRKKLGGGTHHEGFETATLRDYVNFALKGRSLMLFGLSGAAVMQLDKVLISSLISPAALAPYFLASLLCLTPLSILAGPAAQFFQPKIIRALALDDSEGVTRTLKPFVTALVLLTFVPTVTLWLLRVPIISAWLTGSTQVQMVAQYTGILLPGIALGSLGFVPYVLLLGRQDYAFQARMSMLLTVATLAATAGSALMGSVEGVCWIYAAYHTLSTVLSWARCIHLERGERCRYAAQAAVRTALLILMLGTPILAVTLSFNYL